MSNKLNVSRFRDIERTIKTATGRDVFVTGRLDDKGKHVVMAVLEAEKPGDAETEYITLALSAFHVDDIDPPQALIGDMHRDFPAAYEASGFVIRHVTNTKEEVRGGLMPPKTTSVALVGSAMA